MENTILADGTSRFGVSSITDNLQFDYESTIIGEYAGYNIGSSTSFTNYGNTFLGYKSGTNATVSQYNTFIGHESAINIDKGENNIIIGRELANKLSSGAYKLVSTYDIISIGIDNKTNDNSISIGKRNINNGTHNTIVGKNNTIYGNSLHCLGNHNFLAQNSDSVCIGNSNGGAFVTATGTGSNTIIIGNNNLTDSSENFTMLLASHPILIGNNLNHCNYTINIGNVFTKYDNYIDSETVFIGSYSRYSSNSIPVAVGFTDDDIVKNYSFLESSNANASLYAKGGVYTDKLIIGNFSYHSSSVSFGLSSNITSNIQYTLPDIPKNPTNMFLTTKSDGELYWNHIDINGLTSDDLQEGDSNLFYNTSRFDSRFDEKLSYVTLDHIGNGITNSFIKNGIYNRDLVVFGSLTVNKLRVLGVNMKTDTTFDNYIENLINAKMLKWDENIATINSRIDTITEDLTNMIISNDTNVSNYIKRVITSGVV